MPDETISKHISTFSRLYFGPIQYHRDERELVVDGDIVRIEPKSAAALELLIKHHNNVVTREELLDVIWGASGSDEALTQAVSRIRRLFGEAINIKTIPKIGYQLLTIPDTERSDKAVKSVSTPQHLTNKPLIDTPFKGFICGFSLATLIAVFTLLLLMDVQISVEEEYTQDGKVSGTTTITKCQQDNCD